jgi:hypothetical protein
MHRIQKEGAAPGFSDGSVAVELFLRQEPDEDEDEDDDEGGKDDDEDDDTTDDGYSE